MIVKIGADTAQYDKAIRKMQSGMKSIGSSMTSIGKSMSHIFTVPFIGAAAAVIKYGSDYEAQMSKVKAITGANADQMKKFQDVTTKIGMTSKYSSTQAAEALTELVNAGIKSNDAIKALPATLNMASAGGISLGEAAGIASREMNEFEIKSKDMGKVADTLAYAGNHSAGGMKALSEAIVPVGGIAHTAGMSYNDLVSSLSRLSKAGYEGRESGQLMVGVIRAMAAPSKKAAEEQKKLGVAFFDSHGKMRPMADILKDLHEKLGKYNNAQQVAMLKTAFTSQGMRALVPLLRDGGKAVGDMSSQLDKSSGYAKKAADTMNNNLKGSIDTLKNRAETVAASLYTNLGPSLTKVVKEVSKLITAFGNMSPSSQKVVIAIAGVLAAIGPTLVIMGKLIKTSIDTYNTFAKIPKGIAKVKEGFEMLQLSAGKIPTAIKSGTTAVIDFGKQAALAAKQGLVALGNGIKAAALAVVDFGKKTALMAKESLIKLGSMAKTAGLALLDMGKKALIAAAEMLAAGIEAMLPWLPLIAVIAAVAVAVLLIIKYWGPISKFFQKLWQDITKFCVDAWNSLGKFLENNWKQTQKVCSDVWNAIKDFFKKWGLDILLVITGPIGALVILIVKNWDKIKSTTSSIWNAIKSFMSGVWNGIKSVASSVWSSICSGVVNFAGKIKSGVSSAFNSLKSSVMGVWNSIEGGIRSSINGIIGTINRFIGGLGHIKIPSWVPGVGGKSFSIPTIPMLATGGNLMSNGNAIVGEAGPEMITKMGNAVKVTPLSSGERARGISGALGNSDSSGSSNGQTINNYFTVPNLVVREEADIKKIAIALDNQQRKLNRAKGIMI